MGGLVARSSEQCIDHRDLVPPERATVTFKVDKESIGVLHERYQ